MIETLPRAAVVVAAAVSTTVAVAEPEVPVAVTTAAVEVVRVAGAVYRPVELMVPKVAVQLVAPAEVNCWVRPAVSETDVGEIACVAALASETVAVAEPFGPVAVTETEADDGIVVGAVYRPEELTVPAVAVQLVAPEEVNCWVWPRVTDAEVGEIVCEAGTTSVTVAVAELVALLAVTVADRTLDVVAGAV